MNHLIKLANDLDTSGHFALANRVDSVIKSLASNTQEAQDFMGLLQQTQSQVATAYNAIRQLKSTIDLAASKQAERFTPQQNNSTLQNMRSLTQATFQLNQILKTQ